MPTEARIDRLARRLIAEHEQRRWMHAHEHAPSTVFCDVIRRATTLLLERTRWQPTWAQPPGAEDTIRAAAGF